MTERERRSMPRLVPTIHARGEATRLDGVLDLVAFAARAVPLSRSLDELPRRIAAILSADVCSVYLLEGDDLVMRGNVGFPSGALGEVRLALGEGVTGLSVECMRPMSLAAASEHASYRHFPGLGEERFPIFLALPIAGPSGPLGAMVLQRREPPSFDPAEIELAAALTAPIASTIERARLVDAATQANSAPRAAGGGTRRVTLAGRQAYAGRAVGAVCALRRPAARSVREPTRTRAALTSAYDAAVTHANRTLDELAPRATDEGRSLIEGVRTILDDGRLRERTLERAATDGLEAAMVAVGAEASRSAARAGDPFALERAAQIGDVCEALAMLAVAPDRRAELPRGAVLVGEVITVFDALVSARAAPVAIVLSGPAQAPSTRALLTLLGLPAVADVAGLFRWAGEGDIALVDADHGLVRINPGRAEIATLRAAKKQRDA